MQAQMKVNKIYLILIWLLSLTVLFGCSSDSGNPGVAGSETTNGVVVSITGNTVKGVADRPGKAFLVESDYVPTADNKNFIDSLIFEKNENFEFRNIKNGIFNLLIYENSAPYGVKLLNVIVGHYSDTNDTLHYDSLYQKTGFALVNGKPSDEKITVFIKGTALKATADNIGKYTLTNIPSGKWELQARMEIRRRPVTYPSKTIEYGKVFAPEDMDTLNIITE